MSFNQPQQTYDVAQLLQNEHGTFLVQRAGQTAIVTAQEGHSISSWTPVGTIEPSTLTVGNNPPYTCTRISDDVLNQSQNREEASGRNSNQR